jgi:hypothetical protein
VGNDAYEVRSTSEGALDETQAPFSPFPKEAIFHNHLFTLIVDDDNKPIRKLPSLYIDRTQLFSDRDMTTIGRRLVRTVEAIEESPNGQMYGIQGCKIGGRTGLYAREVYNRSAFRIKLTRIGGEFSADPYVRLTEQATFSNRDWGEFEPDFVLLSWKNPDSGVRRIAGAMVPFTLSGFSFGRLLPEDLARLTQACQSMQAFGTADPEALLHRLTTDD